MPEMLAYCGLHCDECKILKASEAKDYDQKVQIAKRWSDQFNIMFKPEDALVRAASLESFQVGAEVFAK